MSNVLQQLRTRCCSSINHYGRLMLNNAVRAASSDSVASVSSSSTSISSNIENPTLQDFIRQASPLTAATTTTASTSPSRIPLPQKRLYFGKSDDNGIEDDVDFQGGGRRIFFEIHGCQMNVADIEIVWSILKDVGYEKASTWDEADIIFMQTCAIRDGAEQKIWNKLEHIKRLKMKRAKSKPLAVGILGCMAERLKSALLDSDKMVDLVAGPDAYRDLPLMLAAVRSGHSAQNVQLSLEETYADIAPVRLQENATSAFVSIQRGCNNMCGYCIVPFTRGRERSRPIESIVEEVRTLSSQGVKEVTLLGQNVNSYRDMSGLEKRKRTVLRDTTEDQSETLTASTPMSDGFGSLVKPATGGRRFAELLLRVSEVDPEMRIRFTSPHPKDFPDEVIDVISSRHNVCKNIHLPAQSGNTEIIMRMRRQHTREDYDNLVDRMRKRIPNLTLSSDFIAGYCGETEEAHKDTLSLIERTRYDMAFLFAYSEREKTHAHRKLTDDVPHEVKIRRVSELIDTFQSKAQEIKKERIGNVELVLVEGNSKRSDDQLTGRTDGNVRTVFNAVPLEGPDGDTRLPNIGEYVVVRILRTTSRTYHAEALRRDSLMGYHYNEISTQLESSH